MQKPEKEFTKMTKNFFFSTYVKSSFEFNYNLLGIFLLYSNKNFDTFKLLLVSMDVFRDIFFIFLLLIP